MAGLLTYHWKVTHSGGQRVEYFRHHVSMLERLVELARRAHKGEEILIERV